MPRSTRSAVPSAPLRGRPAGLAALLLLAACQGDSLYTGDEVTGPHRVVADYTVAVSLPASDSVAFSAPIPVSVTVRSAEGGAGVARVGVTALAVSSTGGDTIVLRAGQSFAAPRRGEETVTLTLHPPALAAATLPQRLSLEVHAFAVGAGGNCVAAVASTPQQLACGTYREDTVARGVRGTRGQLAVLSPVGVAVTVAAGARAAELDTLFKAAVTARATVGGITRVGITALVTNAAQGFSAVLTDSVGYAPPRRETVTQPFAFLVSDLRAASGGRPLPDSVGVEVHAFAVHESGACAAGVSAMEQRLACDASAGGRTAAGGTPQRLSVTLTAGGSVALPAGTRIGAIVVDPDGTTAYLTNTDANQVEVLDLRTLTRLAPIRVGSRPVGLALNRTGDTLMVANSGGVNISFVPLADRAEDVARRFEIPRVTLYEVERDSTGGDVRFYNYNDRPLHVAQDAVGRLIYSAATSAAATAGSARVAEWRPGWREWEPRILFNQRALTCGTADTANVAIANVDSIYFGEPSFYPDDLARQGVTAFDHLPGFPEAEVQGGPAGLDEALEELRVQGSDVVVIRGCLWRVPEGLELSDTSFVVASANRQLVLVGEGVRGGGRLLAWSAFSGRVSQVDAWADIVNNTSDRIVGIAVNDEGTLGAARGLRGVYFFSAALRLQGTVAAGLEGGTGIAFLPGGGSRPLAVAGTSRRTVQVIETTHYRALGEIPIRESLTGPLHVAPPAPGDNAGRTCSADPLASEAGCLVARLVGVTGDGRVAVVELRAEHLQRLQR